MEANAMGRTTITVQFNLGMGAKTIVLGSALPALNNDYTLNGTVANPVTVKRDPNAAAQFRIFEVLAGNTCSFNNLTIKGGRLTGANDGGGILNKGNLSLIGCLLTENQTEHDGGGVFNDAGATLTVAASTISFNKATSGNSWGGGIASRGTLNLNGTQVTDNEANRGGGLHVYSGTCQINTANNFVLNTAKYGGGIYIRACDQFTMMGGSIDSNSTGFGPDVKGGGIYVEGGNNLMFRNVSIKDNKAKGQNNGGKGGGFYIAGGAVTFTDCTLTGNTSDFGPGGAWKAPGSHTWNGAAPADMIVQDP